MSDATAASPAGSQRRALRLQTIDDALAEADRLVAAEQAGRLRHTGNWTLGQALGHLATWIGFAVDGYPASIKPPLFIRLILRTMRNKILTAGLRPGVRIRGVPGGTLGTEELPTEEGLRRFRENFERLRRTAPTIKNPMFGRLTHEQWIQLNLRHVELHLSFFSC